MTIKYWIGMSLGIVALAGCGGGSGDGAGTSAGGRVFISIGTAPAGGAFYAVGNAISNTVDAGKSNLNWQVSAEATKGTKENLRRLEAGEIQFGMANAAISYFALRGEGWDRKYDIRAVATMAPNVGVFIAPASSGISSLEELKGKRVALGPAGAGFDFFLKPLLKAHGVGYEDLTPVNATYTGTVDMLADGKADAAFMGGAHPVPAVTQACASQDIAFLPFSGEALTALPEAYPFYFPAPIKADVYGDLETDLTGINVGSMQLVTHAGVDEEIVYAFTRILYENRARVAEQHPAGKALNPKNIVRDTGTPFHPGAIRYYREIGIWPER